MDVVGMLSIFCDSIVEGLRSSLVMDDVRMAVSSAEHAMAAALHTQRVLRDLMATAPELDMVAKEAIVSRSLTLAASQVSLTQMRNFG